MTDILPKNVVVQTMIFPKLFSNNPSLRLNLTSADGPGHLLPLRRRVRKHSTVSYDWVVTNGRLYVVPIGGLSHIWTHRDFFYLLRQIPW